MAEINHDAEFSKRRGDFVVLESIVSKHVLPISFESFHLVDLNRDLTNMNLLKGTAREYLIKPFEGKVTGENSDRLREIMEKYGIPSQIAAQEQVQATYGSP